MRTYVFTERFSGTAQMGGLTIDYTPFTFVSSQHPFVWISIDTQDFHNGGSDLLLGNDGQDIIIGGQSGDFILGGSGDDDIIGGHNVPGGDDGDDHIDAGCA